jgi:hypothetical protein
MNKGQMKRTEMLQILESEIKSHPELNKNNLANALLTLMEKRGMLPPCSGTTKAYAESGSGYEADVNEWERE